MKNRLAGETSPYLLQHAENPVEWYPWGEEALTRSRAEDKPILLSIGYSSCHWCHVMAHESFEDPAIAGVMNANFVNIKVDREERPDLDQIYQTAHQLIARRGGGWPLTVFLTPDMTPFFAGTYFPSEPRYGMPSFAQVLHGVARAFRERRPEITEQTASVIEALEGTAPPSGTNRPLDDEPIHRAIDALKSAFDSVWGGFSGAPKFPRPAELEFALRLGDAELRSMAFFTLRKMAEGGIHDHLGGGFCRYSVDERWAIPHFEKMLYDNGPLLYLYAEAWRHTGDESFRAAARGIVDWVLREMRGPEGGFLSALDADSEHEEGKFYVWTPQEVRGHLTAEEYAVVSRHYGLDGPPNFENRHWHLVTARPLEEVARELDMENGAAAGHLEAAKKKLFAAREARVRPGCDDKLLASWNALMIRGLAHAGRVFEEPGWVDAAARALDFVRARMRGTDGRLRVSFKGGAARLNAYLDDHAFLLDATLELMQAMFRPADIEFALDLANALLTRFQDDVEGGFFFTSHDHEALIHRPKTGFDNATPSGNGVAAYALQRLALLVDDPRLAVAASRTLQAFAEGFVGQAVGYPTLLIALAEHLSPARVVVLRGPAPDLARWQPMVARLGPGTLPMPVADAEDLPPALAKPLSPVVNAWLCEGVTCLPPMDNPQRVLDAIGA